MTKDNPDNAWWRSPAALGGLVAFLFSAAMSILAYHNSNNQRTLEGQRAGAQSGLSREESIATKRQMEFNSKISDELNDVTEKIDEREVELDYHHNVDSPSDSDYKAKQRRVQQLKSEVASLQKRKYQLEQLLK